MREAIGSSLLLTIVVFFVSVIVLFFASILSYTKAYKAKNRIIDVIDKYEVYNTFAVSEINSSLSEMGYQLGECDKKNENKNSSGYKYCVYEICLGTYDDIGACLGERYYKVTTYVEFYFPVINELLSSVVSGETKILGKNYNY